MVITLGFIIVITLWVMIGISIGWLVWEIYPVTQGCTADHMEVMPDIETITVSVFDIVIHVSIVY